MTTAHTRRESLGGASPKTYLSAFRCMDVCRSDKHVLVATQDTTVEQAMAILEEHRIISLPVYDTRKKDYVGVISLMDIASAIAFQELFKKYDLTELNKMTPDLLLKTQNLPVFHAPVTALIGISEESRNLWTYDSKDLLSEALSVFSKGVHRALIRFKGSHSILAPHESDSHGAYYRMLTQTDVLRFLCEHAEEKSLRSMFEKDLKALSIVSEKQASDPNASSVVAIPSTYTALAGFQKIALSNVPAVAVVNETGSLIATLSSSDLRGLSQSNFSKVLLPVLEFLSFKHKEEKKVQITCVPSSTVMEVAKKMLGSAIHRVWVVNNDAESRPIGVVSQTDIVKLFA